MACKDRNRYWRMTSQSGTALVEFTITFIVFIALVFAIIEFALATFNWSRMVQATQAGARYAITADPACDIYGYRDEGHIPDCDDGTLSTSCVAGDQVSRNISSCSEGSTDSGCRIVEQMRRFSPYILAGGSSVTVTYTCSETGDPELPQPVPLVTVAAEGVPYHFLAPGLLGIDATVTMPSFETTRVGEDLYTSP